MWYDCLDNNKFLTTLYQSVPKLTNVEIVKVSMSDGGFNITVLFVMPSTPDFLPKKWREKEYNSVMVKLDFFAISKLNICTDSNEYVGNIEIERTEDELIAIKISGNIEAQFQAEGGLIQSVEGFISSSK